MVVPAARLILNTNHAHPCEHWGFTAEPTDMLNNPIAPGSKGYVSLRACAKKLGVDLISDRVGKKPDNWEEIRMKCHGLPFGFSTHSHRRGPAVQVAQAA